MHFQKLSYFIGGTLYEKLSIVVPKCVCFKFIGKLWMNASMFIRGFIKDVFVEVFWNICQWDQIMLSPVMSVLIKILPALID